MEHVAGWFAVNGFQALQAAGILGGLLFTAFSFRQNARVQRAQFLINITQQHRAIWLEVFDSPKLKRILSKSPPRGPSPTQDEMLFVNLIILHLTSTQYAMRKGILDKPAGLDVDLKDFFSLPIPAAVWRETKHLRDTHTVRYVESLLTPPTKKQRRRRRSWRRPSH